MIKRFDWKVLIEEYKSQLEEEKCRIAKDGTIWLGNNMIDPQACSSLAEVSARLYAILGKKKDKDFATSCMNYARECSIYYKGVYFWVTGVNVAALCDQGRLIRRLYSAAKILRNKEIMNWLADFLKAWPYLPKEHRWVERFVPGLVKETSLKEFSHTFNMQLEGAVDACLVGEALGDKELIGRGEDVIFNFFLPNQREDGLWDYRHPSGRGRGPNEINYSLYCLVILSHLLEFKKWKLRIEKPIYSSLQTIEKRYRFADGSLYAPVHWGWAHIWESTIFYAYVSSRLMKYCGHNYSPRIAQALNWLLRCRLEGGGLEGALKELILGLVLEKIEVEGEMPGVEKILTTLRRVEREIRIVRADNTPQHQVHYFTVSQPIWRKTQRLIQRLVSETKEPPLNYINSLKTKKRLVFSGELATWKGSTPLSLLWWEDPKILSANIYSKWDKHFLYFAFEVANKKHCQEYKGINIFFGDGVILAIAGNEKEHLYLYGIALTKEGPLVWRYNEKLPLGSYLWGNPGEFAGYPVREPSLNGVKKAKCLITKGRLKIFYEVGIPWQELSPLSPQKGKALKLTILLTDNDGRGMQYNYWGSDLMEKRDISLFNELRLISPKS